MRVSAAERATFFAQHLGPALAARSNRVGILDWDHNWDQPEEPLGCAEQRCRGAFVEGVAWHCYGGDSKVMAEVKAAHPAKDLFFTECSGGDWAPKWGDTLEWMTDNLIIATVRAGGKGSVLWNLALDENGRTPSGRLRQLSRCGDDRQPDPRGDAQCRILCAGAGQPLRATWRPSDLQQRRTSRSQVRGISQCRWQPGAARPQRHPRRFADHGEHWHKPVFRHHAGG